VRQLLEHEVEKLNQSCSSSVQPMDSGPEQMIVESRSTDAVAAATETSTQQSNATAADTSAVTNARLAVTRSAPQRHYKEMTTYGEMHSCVTL